MKSTLNADISIQGISYSVHAVSFIACKRLWTDVFHSTLNMK